MSTRSQRVTKATVKVSKTPGDRRASVGVKGKIKVKARR